MVAMTVPGPGTSPFWPPNWPQPHGQSWPRADRPQWSGREGKADTRYRSTVDDPQPIGCLSAALCALPNFIAEHDAALIRFLERKLQLTRDVDAPAHPQTPAPLAAEEVIRICKALWKGKKRCNLVDPNLGDTSWDAMIAVSEGMIEDMVRRMVAKPREVWRKRELIVIRRVMDVALRVATEPPAFYGVPLYVSAGVLDAAAAVLERRRASNAKTTERLSRGRIEHVLPLRVFASGTEIIRDPKAKLPGIRRAFVGPICRVTAEEDGKLPRKANADPDRPFLRYAEAEVAAYRVQDGLPVDGRTYCWADHIKHMMAFPSYASGAEMTQGGETHWNRILEETGFRGFPNADVGVEPEEKEG